MLLKAENAKMRPSDSLILSLLLEAWKPFVTDKLSNVAYHEPR